MRWSIVRLIAGKEFRDLIRDRRTVMLILVLPAVLYPAFGAAAWSFAVTLLGQPTNLGLVGWEQFRDAPDRFPDFVVEGKIAPGLESDETPATGPIRMIVVTEDPDEALKAKRVDAVLVFPPGVAAELAAGKRPVLKVLARDGDEKSKLASKRLIAITRAWEDRVREKRFAAKGLPKDFDKVFKIEDPQTDKPTGKKAADEFRDAFAKIFPFILMMWLVAGAIQPAVDMTAGEKERGTMETLLISPAERSEIVAGKFLAVTGFSFTSVVWNVIWLTGAGVLAEQVLGFPILNFPGIIGCVVLGLPMAMFFSAICIALGVFAKSTKEGQYYLMPLLLFTMPLAFGSMMPGAELGPKNCWIPVTGAMLLQQRLLSVSSEPIPWEYFPPVLGSLAVWVGLALAFAAWQFRREGVLFRETATTRRGWFSRK